MLAIRTTVLNRDTVTYSSLREIVKRWGLVDGGPDVRWTEDVQMGSTLYFVATWLAFSHSSSSPTNDFANGGMHSG